jgi:hypothetical protein
VVEAGDHPRVGATAAVVEDPDGAELVAGGDAVVDAAGRAGDVGAVLDVGIESGDELEAA